jgi:hypothetical protein
MPNPTSSSQLPLQIPLQPPTHTTLTKPIPKANSDRRKKSNAEQSRTPFVMVRDSPPLPDLPNAPEIQRSRVNERDACYDGKRPRGGKRQCVAKVEQSGGNGANENGELEPGEEGALGGELNFGFDADGDVNAWYDVSTVSRICWTMDRKLTFARGRLKPLDFTSLFP